VFISAGDSSLRRTDALSAARIIHGRSFDCDEYERSRELSDLPAAFDVFVDSGGPLHPDYDYLGFRRSALPNDYFSVLKNFLSTAEQTTGRPVLIARHPRMKNVPYQDFLPEFEIFDDVTASLIQKSTAVFDTGSTATSFSVLAHKQVFYLTPGALPGSAEWRLATGIARSLGREASTTTEQFVNDLRRAEEIPFHTFDSYRREYLFSDLSSRRSFAEEITSLLREE